MNYNKVIKDLKERNDKLQEQYRLRDIRCIHLEYENEMLKNDFEAQHELTKKYAEENQELKEKLSKIETLIINHNCDTGDIYYKYNRRFLKSELKQRILEIVYEEESDSDE